MDNTDILQKRRKINNHLDNKHLRQALINLKDLIKAYPEWHFSEKLEQIETSYRYMLRYMRDGFEDPERDKLYRKLLSDTYRLTDIVSDYFLQKNTSSVFYSKRRVFTSGADSIEDAFKRLKILTEQQSLAEGLELSTETDEKQADFHQLKSEEDAISLFNAVWTNLFPDSDQMELIRKIFREGEIQTVYQQLLVSALTLNLISWYDEAKLDLLIDLISNKDENINQRALVGTLFVLQSHQKRASITGSIDYKLQFILDNPTIIKRIRTIQVQLIRTRETERITKKLNEEILPEMMKMASPLYNKIKTDDLLKDSDEQEMNPEWEEFIKNSKIEDKLKEISELQLEGSDVLMSAFANLKSFSFFQQTANWFLPFFKGNSHLKNIFQEKNQNDQFVEFVLNSRFLCNSDKYSFSLSLSQMPQMQRSMMAEQFSAQAEELEQINHIQDAELKFNKEERISNLYIQDLYRFFKLYPQRKEFSDPFALDLKFYQIPVLKPLFSDLETLHMIAEIFFRKEFYEDAISVFEQLTELDHTHYEIFQKLGYCYQHLEMPEKAIRVYKQADIIHPDSPWTLRKLAQCYRNIKNTNEALSYYDRYNKLKPGNLSVELNMGHCYLEMKDYESALSHYFKVDYLNPQSDKAWRPIAWCSFLIGKYDQAQRYYKKIIQKSPTRLDYINAGHTEWLLKNIPGAIAYYQKGLIFSENKIDEFEKIFLHDKIDLLHAGISETDFYLMIDQLLYSSDEI
ncbi:MAG: tetratricopeptide repeat protein [Bacteroidales bacterium]